MAQQGAPRPVGIGRVIVGIVGFIAILAFLGHSCSHEGSNTASSMPTSSTALSSDVHAAPGSGDSPKDSQFIEALDIGKIPYANRDDAVAQAQATCVYLSPANGGSYVSATQFIAQHNPSFTDEQVGFFVGAGVQVLCPDEASALPTQ